MVICHIGPDNAMLKYLQKNLIQWVKVAMFILILVRYLKSLETLRLMKI